MAQKAITGACVRMRLPGLCPQSFPFLGVLPSSSPELPLILICPP